MGGRMCSMAVAEGLPAAGLVLISYPLHPPGRPDRLRVEHLPALTVPCLFVSGTRDPFGTPAELEAATAAIPGPVTHVWIEGAGHEVKGHDRRGGADGSSRRGSSQVGRRHSASGGPSSGLSSSSSSMAVSGIGDEDQDRDEQRPDEQDRQAGAEPAEVVGHPARGERGRCRCRSPTPAR